MPTEVDIYVQTLVNFAKANDTQRLKTLLSKARSIHLKNSAGFSAAMLLAKENQRIACKTLSDFGAKPFDLIYGAACANNKETINYFVNQYQLQNLEPIILGAISGGHQELAQQYIMMLDKDKRDFNAYVIHALKTGNDLLAHVYLKEIPENDRQHRAYAISAAQAGLASSVLLFIKENDCNEIAQAAAAGGHRELAELIVNRLDESKRGYLKIAISAASRGHTNIVDYFINKIPENSRNYSAIASSAFQGGNFALAALYSTKATQFYESNKFTPVFGFSAGAHPPVIQTAMNVLNHPPLTVKIPGNIIATAVAATSTQAAMITNIPTPTVSNIPTPKASNIPTPKASNIPAPTVTNELSKKRAIEDDIIDEKNEKNQELVNDSSQDKDIKQQNINPRPKKRQKRDPLEIDTVEGKRNKGVIINNFERSTKLKAKETIHFLLTTQDSDNNPRSREKLIKSESVDSQINEPTPAFLARFSGSIEKSQEIQTPGLNASTEIVVAQIVDEMDVDQNEQETQKPRDTLR